MAKGEGDFPNFEELDLPGDELGDADLLEEPVADDVSLSGSGIESLSADALEEVEDEKGHAPPKKERSNLLNSLAAASPYTVMLGMALVAILIAIGCLTLEFGSYGFQTHP